MQENEAYETSIPIIKNDAYVTNRVHSARCVEDHVYDGSEPHSERADWLQLERNAIYETITEPISTAKSTTSSVASAGNVVMDGQRQE